MKVRPVPLAVRGFRAAGVHCGVKKRDRDLALIVCDDAATAAGVFTRSTASVGAPVSWCRRIVRTGTTRGVVINSGNANVATGPKGIRDTEMMARLVAEQVGCKTRDVFVCSTGVIGEPLPMPAVTRGIPDVAGALAADVEGWEAAADAIRTTDTYAKRASTRMRVGRKLVSVSGIAKGSGMCEPNLATMLGFIVTDAAVEPRYLKTVLRRVCDETFNRVTVDGETSTSDSVLLFASGRAGNSVLRGPRSPGAARFEAGVRGVAESLARDLARDGEGATKLVTVEVTGAKSAAEADRGARRIANSLLVKTALFGGDPNWGRILQTLGAGQLKLETSRMTIELGGVVVFRKGVPAGAAARRRAEAALKKPEILIRAHLGVGRAAAHMWTCDLTYDYVRINAEYTT